MKSNLRLIGLSALALIVAVVVVVVVTQKNSSREERHSEFSQTSDSGSSATSPENDGGDSGNLGIPPELAMLVPVPRSKGKIDVISSADNKLSKWKGPQKAGIRARKIQLNPAIMRDDVIMEGQTLSFNLFGDVKTEAVVSESFRNVNGTISTTAKVAGTHHGRVFMACTDGLVTARIRIPEQNRIFSIEHDQVTGNYHALELNPALAEPDEGNDVRIPPASDEIQVEVVAESQTPPIAGAEGTDASAVVDIMVVYSDDALATAGSQAAMDNRIAMGIAAANDAHTNTGTFIVWNLVHSYMVNYDESSATSDLSWVTNDPDVATNRDNYGADFVIFSVSDVGGGVGWAPSNPNGSPGYAFCVVGYGALPTYTTPHEVGHNMGLAHARDQDYQWGNTPWNPDSHGWGSTRETSSTGGWHWHPTAGQTGYCTVMTYTGGSYFDGTPPSGSPNPPAYAETDGLGHVRIGYFSDPNINDPNNPSFATGNATYGDSATVLRTMRHLYAAYRNRLTGTQILVDYPNGGETLTAGNTYIIKWDSNNVSGEVKVELYKDGSLDSVIDADTLNDRCYAWTIPGAKSGNGYAIRVSDVNTGSIADISDATFSIDTAFYNEPMNSNPGYTGTSSGGWEFGAPFGDNPTYGGADGAYTGTNCYDTNLDGGSFNTHYLTTTAIDCSSYASIRLNFMGWFRVNTGYSVTVDISNDGTNWTNLLNEPAMAAASWNPYSYDISTVADGQSTVYVRWGHVKGAGGSNYSGMTVDDVTMSGIYIGTDPYISVDPGTFEPSCNVGTNASNQTFNVRNTGTGTINYSITDNQSWLSVSPSSGSSSGEDDTITVNYNTSGLAAGTHSATITVTDAGASNSPVTIPVTLTVVGPAISTSVSSLSPSCGEGSNAPDDTFTVSNSGGGTLNYSISDNQTWLSVSPTSGTSTGEADTITVSYATAGLGLGTYNATITVTDGGASNSPQTIAVSLRVKPNYLYYEDFDSSSDIPTDMTQEQTLGSVTWHIANGGINGNPSSAHSGSNNARLNTLTYPSTYTTLLYTPVFSTANYTNITLSFWHAQLPWAGDQDTLKVLYSTNGGTDWTELANYTASVTSWTQRTLSIPTASANTKIAFEGTVHAGYGVCLDDIIVDGDPSGPPDPSVTISVNNASINENGGSSTVTATLSASHTTTVTVNLAYSGSATGGGVDYNASATSITIPAGNTTGTATISAVNDTIDESNETVVIDIASVANGTESGTQTETVIITDDDNAPSVTLGASPTTIAEASGSSTLTATLSNPSSQTVTVNLAYSGSATGGGTDYTSSSSITVGAGAVSGTATVTAVQDAIYEGNETIVVDISSVSNGTESGTQSRTITITDDDPVPYTLTVTNGTGDGDYVAGTDVAIVADAPLAGFRFDSWTTSDGGTFADASAASTTYTMPANAAEVTANYVLNNAPTANAGSDQNVNLSGSPAPSPVAGAYYEWDASTDTGGDAVWNSTGTTAYTWTFDSGNQTPTAVSDARFDNVTGAYEFPAAKDATNTSFSGHGDAEPATFEFVIDVDGADGSIFETGGSGDGLQVDVVGGAIRGTVEEDPTEPRVSYTLTATDLSRYIHVAFVVDGPNNVVQLYVDGDLKDSQPWTTSDDWAGTDGASLGGRSGSTPDGGSTADFVGKIALFRYYRNKAFTAAEVTQNFDSLSTGVSATVNLDGTVGDDDGDPLTTTWSLVSGPGAPVTFGSTSDVDTTATFTQEGVYTLRLTADDTIDQTSDECVITVGPADKPIVDSSLPAGVSLYGYTGKDPIDAQTAFQTLIDNNELALVRWVDPTSGDIKELYYTTFPAPAWVNDIGNMTLGQGYVVKTTGACLLCITGSKDTSSVTHNLPTGYSIVGFNQETPLDAQTVFQPLIDAGKLELVRWVDPSTGGIKELYYTNFPAAGWVNEIGDLTEGQGYIIKLNAPHAGFSLP